MKQALITTNNIQDGEPYVFLASGTYYYGRGTERHDGSGHWIVLDIAIHAPNRTELSEVATVGPAAGSRTKLPGLILRYDAVQAIASCTPEAVASWEAA